ncbi:hypothetical protein AWW72_07760 [Acinetobacter sp. NRRL B-65365]|uniref:hypothetical protein n=1 Tax=Acinetobacter sp. NRRL B-65365 TaxID=1785092 RepID=UPI0007A07049|nr:hypothetical protein [Acinetobacter sp. NRRL B-65365]KYQ84541.1 hypothetical protein AWW72_07760 [Acinetobacter sp. NRRL B-65365]
MKFNKITLSIVACTLGVSIYTYQLYAGKSPQAATGVVTSTSSTSLDHKNNRVLVKNLNDAQALFNILYKPVDKNAIKNKEDLENFSKAKDSEFNFIAYLDAVLSAYQYKGIKTYKNNGVDRYLVAFTHKDAVYADMSSEGSMLDLFLFQKVGESYELIASTSSEGLVNGSSGSTAKDDMAYDHIMNSEPINIGKNHKGFAASLSFGGGGQETNFASIILIDESKNKIYEIDNEIKLAQKHWGSDTEFSYDSFYFLDESTENKGVYNLNVLYEGNKDVSKEGSLVPKIVPYNVYKTYEFDGNFYKLKDEQPNPYSEVVDFNGYNKYFSTLNYAGYAPVPYKSILEVVDMKYGDYWLSKGIRVYKPELKTEEFFTWKVKGVKVHGLDVIGVKRGVCNISGEDRCGYAGDTIVVFDASFDQARKILKEKTFVDYANLNSDDKGRYPELDSINFEGKVRAALYMMNENP